MSVDSEDSKTLPSSEFMSGDICPHLRMLTDSELRAGFAHPGNACYHAAPVQTVNLTQQDDVCLNERHILCPVFAPDWKGRLPKNLRGKKPVMDEGDGFPFSMLLWGAGLIAAGLLLYFLVSSGTLQGLFGGVPTPEAKSWTASTNTPPLATQPATLTSAPSPSQFVLSATEITASVPVPATGIQDTETGPAPTLTLFGSDFSIGPGGQYAVHTILDGESLEMIANRYKTTLELLQSINFGEFQPKLVTGSTLVIAPGQSGPMPIYRLAAQKIYTKTPLNDILEKYKMDQTTFSTYNPTSTDPLEAGQWILITKPLALPTPTHSPTVTATPTPTSSKTATHTNTPTATLSPTNTAIVNTPGPGINMRFGPGGRYLIHVVLSGESIEQVSTNFYTSPEVIKKVNFLPNQVTLWSNTVLVLLPGEMDVNKVSPLRGVFIDHIIKVPDFLKAYQINETWFRENNQIDGDLIGAGRWVVVNAGN